jgi:hypothetical protein
MWGKSVVAESKISSGARSSRKLHQHSRCRSRDSKGAPREYKSQLLSLRSSWLVREDETQRNLNLGTRPRSVNASTLWRFVPRGKSSLYSLAGKLDQAKLVWRWKREGLVTSGNWTQVVQSIVSYFTGCSISSPRYITQNSHLMSNYSFLF